MGPGKLWVVETQALHSQAVSAHLGKAGEPVMAVGVEECALRGLMTAVERQW